MKSRSLAWLSALALGLTLSSAHADAPPPKPAAPAAAVAPVTPPKAAPAPVGSTARVDWIVALVNGAPVWRSTVDSAIAPILASDPKAFRGELEPKVIDTLISELVIRQQADAVHMETSPEEVEQALKDVAQQNQLDLAGLQAAVEQHGFTMASYRAEIAKQIRTEKLFRMWLTTHQPTPATDDEMKQTLARYKAQAKAGAPEPDADKLREEVYLEKVAAARQAWIEQLRTAARIERR